LCVCVCKLLSGKIMEGFTETSTGQFNMMNCFVSAADILFGDFLEIFFPLHF